MHNNVLIVSVASLALALPALASDRDDDIGRVQKATQVFQEIMRTPDKGIPQDLLENAKCVAIIPGEEKAAFIFGGNYGKGLATCRTENGWSAPMFVAVGGGSVGFQIGECRGYIPDYLALTKADCSRSAACVLISSG